MADFLTATIQSIDERLGELSAECERLHAARAALVGRTDGPTGPGAKTRSPRSRRTTSSRTGTRRGGSRADQALAAITRTPGITISQLAEKLGTPPNYLYRVVPRLIADGLVAKDGSALTAVASRK